MIVQIIGHGVNDSPVLQDQFVIRFCGWAWQKKNPVYGLRTDITVGTENRQCKCDWMYTPNRKVDGKWIDITHYAKDYNTDKQWLSTGSVAILAAHELWGAEVWLYGFTALESGRHQKRVAPTKGKTTRFHDYQAERNYLERKGINFRFVH